MHEMPLKPPEILRKRLLELRERHGGVAEFCRKSGFNRQSVENWLDGESVPGLDSLDRIARALDVSPAALISDPAQAPWARIPGDVVDGLSRCEPHQIEMIRQQLVIFARNRELEARLSAHESVEEIGDRGHPGKKGRQKPQK
jgi:transcriptional regulator with XRE-family HTH domain